MRSANFLRFSPTDGIGPTKGQRKTLTRVGIEPTIAAPPTELQGQTGAGRGKWRCQLHGNEYVHVQGRVTFMTSVGRVALPALAV